jgi:hypothetical protein
MTENRMSTDRSESLRWKSAIAGTSSARARRNVGECRTTASV